MSIIPASHFQHLHPHDIDMLYEKSTQNAESSKHVKKNKKITRNGFNLIGSSYWMSMMQIFLAISKNKISILKIFDFNEILMIYFCRRQGYILLNSFLSDYFENSKFDQIFFSTIKVDFLMEKVRMHHCFMVRLLYYIFFYIYNSILNSSLIKSFHLRKFHKFI